MLPLSICVIKFWGNSNCEYYFPFPFTKRRYHAHFSFFGVSTIPNCELFRLCIKKLESLNSYLKRFLVSYEAYAS